MARTPAPAPVVAEPSGDVDAVLVRMSSDLHEEIKAAAAEDDRSQAALIRVAIREHLDRRRCL